MGTQWKLNGNSMETQWKLDGSSMETQKIIRKRIKDQEFWKICGCRKLWEVPGSSEKFLEV